MTKKEFAYWERNIDKFLSMEIVYINFNKPIEINKAYIIKDKNYKTDHPKIVYGTYLCSSYSIFDLYNVKIHNDKLIIKCKLLHYYLDKEYCVDIITNTFERKNIGRIYF